MNILVIGDSWASALESDTRLNRGWPFFAGIPASLRQGISGSKAIDWASDKDGYLSRAVNSSHDVDCVVISLLGNDVRHLYDDGKITLSEVVEAIASMRKVVRSLSHVKHVVLIGYCDPYFGADKKTAIGVPLINSGVKLASVGISNTTIYNVSDIARQGHFDGVDFHMNEIGHRVMASDILRFISQL